MSGRTNLGVGLAVLPFVIAVAYIWTGDNRWGWTAIVLIPFGLTGLALIGTERKP